MKYTQLVLLIMLSGLLLACSSGAEQAWDARGTAPANTGYAAVLGPSGAIGP